MYVALYGMNRVKGSCDGFMAMSVESLGLEYYAIAYHPTRFKTQLGISASVDSTEITVSLPANQGTYSLFLIQPNDSFHIYQIYI